MSATAYPIRFAWAAHSYGTPDTHGQAVDVYAATVNLWGGYDGERYASTSDVLDSATAGTGCTIRIRQYPDVQALDTLTDPQTGEVWTVDTVRRGDNEVIAEVSR
jgi:hypothetical protein